VGELILKCAKKWKKMTWYALIGGCKTRALYGFLI
jgi:hypothetical protein